MAANLLRTKLYFPPVRLSLVPRPRLVERLQTGLLGPLTLLSAPAGCGKTTLLSEWRAGPGAGSPVAWLSLDADDNDPSRFLHYLAAALDGLHPGLAKEVQPLLQPPELPNPEAILTLAVNRLGNLEREAVLALDDYHQIETPAIHKMLAFLLDHLPPHLHLVILTRADPPLPLARLRAGGQLTEIRAGHLRFSVDEAAAFLDQVMGLDLSGEQAAALEERTEGWIAGLQLAALSMQGLKDVTEFVSAFTGSNHYIVDYLAEEVLGRQPERVRQFLLQTSVLERLTGPLCDALTGQPDGKETLEQLEHANLFVIPLDNEQYWYRYHHLFADLLRNRLRHLHPDALPGLHHRAAEWFEKEALFFDALEHLLAAGEYEHACDLLGENALVMIREHRLSTILRWMKVIPDPVVRANPRVSIIWGYAQEALGDIDAFASYVESAEKALSESAVIFPPGSASHAAMLADIKVNQADIAVRRGELESALTLTDEVIAMAPADEHFTLSQAYFYSAWAKRDLGQIEAGIPLCERALTEARLAGHPGMTASAVFMLGNILKVLGHLRRSIQALREGLHYAQEMRQDRLSIYAMVHYELARALCEANDLDQAEFHLAQGIQLGEQGARPLETLEGHVLKAWLHMARGENQVALQLLEKTVIEEQATGIQQFHEELTYYRAKIQSGLGNTGEAVEWLKGTKVEVGKKLGYPQGLRALRRVHLLLGLDRLDEAIALSLRIAAAAGKGRCASWQVEALAMLALAWQKKGDSRQALESLEKALAKAGPEGFLRTFLVHGQPMLELLRLARSKGVIPDHALKILSAAPTSTLAQAPGQQVLITPLSQRELELLALIAAGRSNKEIAADLVISLGTVKRHTVNIFNKLDVKNRTEAVAKARQLGLL